ncbi:MAG TPA: peptidase MA family metallohydrolase, partial [Ktedonobacterales bacterium]
MKRGLAKSLSVVLLVVAALGTAVGSHAPGARAQRGAGLPEASTSGVAASRPAQRVLLPVMERAYPHNQLVNRAQGGRPGDFPFQTAQSADGLIVIHYYYQSTSFGDDFLNMAQGALREYVQPKLGYSLKSRVDIYVYNSRSDFLAGAQPENPEITGALSIFSPSSIYIPLLVNAYDTVATLAHELTHITFHQQIDVGHLDSDYRLVPLWFEEGQAASDESDNSFDGAYDNGLIQNIRAGGRFIDIFSQFVWQYPQDPNTDNLCYAEARSFVNFLYNSYGATRYHQFVADLTNGNLPYATEVDFGADLQTLESQWETSLGQPALQHASGALPLVETPTQFSPGHLPTLENQTQPYAVGGGDQVIADALVQAGIGFGVVLLGLGVGAFWTRRRRRFFRARLDAPPLGFAPTYPNADPPPWGTPPSAAPAPVTVPLYTQSPQPPVVVPAISAEKAPAALSWIDYVALALAVPLVLGVGLLWTRIDPAQSWPHDELAAAGAALVLAGVVALLTRRAWRGGRVVVPHVVAATVLLASVLIAGRFDAQVAGIAQAQAYEHESAYALALRAFADAGAPKADLRRVQMEWADIAYNRYSDYAAATEHYRAAIALAATPSESQA